MYGALRAKYLHEKLEFRPQSPYASSKRCRSINWKVFESKKTLKWSPKLKFKSIVKIMVDADLENYTLYNYIKTKVLHKH